MSALNLLRFTALAATGLLLLSVGRPVLANTVVEVTGLVTPGTCAVHTDDVDKIVTMPDMTAAGIPADAGPIYASKRSVNLRLVNCAGVDRATFTFSGLGAINDEWRWRNLNSLLTRGISIWLFDGNTITPGGYGPAGETPVRQVQVNGSTASLPFDVYYWRLPGPFVPGDVTARIQVQVGYD